MANLDTDALDDISQDDQNGQPETVRGCSGTRKKRARHFSSDERARHRIIERERREAFNTSLLELASLLPALDDTKESLLSKHLIVQESIKQHQSHQAAIDEAERRLLVATAERDALQRQLEQLLLLSGDAAVSNQHPIVQDGLTTGQTGWTPQPSGFSNAMAPSDLWDGHVWVPTNFNRPEAVIETLFDRCQNSAIT
ncbi:hypothetical protein DOTSEDRAFT_72883 [Dothistroma septosporum NZE10]|uniref:BHLH domain-containing protein n=1 Tax=Dothistroma septosporum (strain NZE10 / CBS 128990) TaxID=675120 RepID=M2YNR1_DOTSN|nr:hypothetical protein DOTSEDRAFT_72883 [Dothistroma septosporum NZE10]